MKNRKLYILLIIAGLISLILAIWLVNLQKKSKNNKLGIKQATSNVVQLTNPEQINYPAVNSTDGTLIYFSNEKNSFYKLNNSGNRILKCNLGIADLVANNVTYSDSNHAVVSGIKKLTEEEISLFVNINNCAKKILDPKISMVDWSNTTNKFVYQKMNEEYTISEIVAVDREFENPETLGKIDGQLMNVAWLDNNNVGFTYLSTDNSPIDVYKFDIQTKKTDKLLSQIKAVESLTFYDDGLLAYESESNKGVTIRKFKNGKLEKFREVEDTRLKDLDRLNWISQNELVITTRDQYGNTKAVFLFDLAANKLWTLKFDKKDLDYAFTDFKKINNNQIIGLSENVPYIFTID